jgi:hypothetical protein
MMEVVGALSRWRRGARNVVSMWRSLTSHHEQLTVIPNWFIQLKNETGKNVKRGPAEWLE